MKFIANFVRLDVGSAPARRKISTLTNVKHKSTASYGANKALNVLGKYSTSSKADKLIEALPARGFEERYNVKFAAIKSTKIIDAGTKF